MGERCLEPDPEGRAKSSCVGTQLVNSKGQVEAIILIVVCIRIIHHRERENAGTFYLAL